MLPVRSRQVCLLVSSIFTRYVSYVPHRNFLHTRQVFQPHWPAQRNVFLHGGHKATLVIMTCKTLHYSIFLYFHSICFIAFVYFYICILFLFIAFAYCYIWIQSLLISIVYFSFSSIVVHLNSIYVNFYCICFVFILYSIRNLYLIDKTLIK